MIRHGVRFGAQLATEIEWGTPAVSTNDYWTLSISLLALIVSMASAVAAYRQQGMGLRTTIRDQLTTVVQSLINTQAELEVVNIERDVRPSPLNSAKAGTINQKLTSLMRQACELNNLEPDVAFDVELLTVANALATSGDIPLAEHYYVEAIRKAPSGYYKTINLSVYARFLYAQSREGEGRAAYRDALSVLDASTDFNKWSNGQTLISWIYSEAQLGPAASPTPDELYQQAEALYRQIRAPGLRASALRELAATRTAPTDSVPGDEPRRS